MSDLKFENTSSNLALPISRPETIEVGKLDTVNHDTILEQNKESDTSHFITERFKTEKNHCK